MLLRPRIRALLCLMALAVLATGRATPSLSIWVRQ